MTRSVPETRARLAHNDLMLLSAGLTFYAAMAIIPLLLLAVFLVGSLLGHAQVQDLVERLAGLAPEGLGFSAQLVELVGTLLVLATFALVAVLPDLLGTGLGTSVLGGYLTFLAAWLGGMLLLGVTYRAFSPVPLRTPAWLWASAGTGSFLAGMSLGWVVVLEVGLEVGQAYGGSEALGAGVLFAIYLFLVQLTCLVGYAWALALNDSASFVGGSER